MPEAFPVAGGAGAVSVVKEGTGLIRPMGAHSAAVAVRPGPRIGPHSLELLSEADGCCVATERMVAG